MTKASKAQTRGFLFADLRGYSAFTETHGDRAAEDLLRRYRKLVREVIAVHDGAEIRTEGDSFYVVFDSVSDAVQAGVAIRDAAVAAGAEAEGAPIRVGVGIHAGESHDGDEGIVSSAVNIAARVCALAAPGEVLVTDTVRSLTRTHLSVPYEPRGRRRLKGIAEPVELFRVSATDGRAKQRRAPSMGRLAAGMAVVGLAVVITVTAVALTGRASPASAPVSPSSGVDAGSSASEQLPSPSVADGFPDAAEAALLDRLPSVFATSCERADPESAPVYEKPISYYGRATQFTDVPLGVYGGIDCLVGVNRATFWRSIGTGNIEAVFIREVAKLHLTRGSCSNADDRGWESWKSGANEGQVLCHVRPDGTAVVEWTYDDEALYAVATRRDGDLESLLAWWKTEARLMSR